MEDGLDIVDIAASDMEALLDDGDVGTIDNRRDELDEVADLLEQSSDDDEDEVNASALHHDGNEDATMEHLRATEGDATAEELRSMSKRDAKMLGKAIYKSWKKLHKKDKKKDKGSKDNRKEKDKKKVSKRSRDEEELDLGDDNEEGVESIRERRGKKGRKSKLTDELLHQEATFAEDPLLPQRSTQVAREPKTKKTKGAAGKKKGATLAQLKEANEREAQRLVQEMQRAHEADVSALQSGQPPLSRLALITEVLLICRREAMQELLVKAGFLSAISSWLYDPNSKEIGPLDLRTAALDALLAFDYQGTSSARLLRWKEKERERADKDKEIFMDYFRGIGRDDLEQSDLGEAVNVLRTHPQESLRNRSSAIALLQRFSRSWNYDGHAQDDEDDEGEGSGRSKGVQWKCKDDPTVAPPFDPIRTAAERFHQTVSAVDELNPMAYLKQPPKRYQKGYITNLHAIKL